MGVHPKVDRRHGHLTMDSPSHPREGEPVLKMGPSGLLLHRAKSAPRGVRQLRPRRAPRGRARISKTTTEAIKTCGLSSSSYRHFSGSGPLPGGPGHVLAAPSAVQRRVVSRQVAEIQDGTEVERIV